MRKILILLVLVLTILGCNREIVLKKSNVLKAPYDEKLISKGDYKVNIYRLKYPKDLKGKQDFFEEFNVLIQKYYLKGKKVNARQAMAWAEDRIEYDDITLGEMVKKLSRQYDVHIQLESEKLGDMKFRVSLRNKETIVDVMDALKEIIPIKVEYKEKDIYIR